MNKAIVLKLLEKIFPCMSGSALQDTGIVGFLTVLVDLTYTEYSSDRCIAYRCKK